MEISLYLGIVGERGVYHCVLFTNEIFIKCSGLTG